MLSGARDLYCTSNHNSIDYCAHCMPRLKEVVQKSSSCSAVKVSSTGLDLLTDVLDSRVQGQGSHMLVERQSRISFECPADILMEDLLNDDMKGPGDENDLDSILNKLLEAWEPLKIKGVWHDQMRVYGCLALDWARANVIDKVIQEAAA